MKFKVEGKEGTLTSVGNHGRSVIAEANLLAQRAKVIRRHAAPPGCFQRRASLALSAGETNS